MTARRTLVLAALVLLALVANGDETSDAGTVDVPPVSTGGSSTTTDVPNTGVPTTDVPTTDAPATDLPAGGPSSTSGPRPSIEQVPPTDPLVPDLDGRGAHGELREIDGWLQSDVASLEELRGNVVAVQFWTFGCHNCRATLPHMQALYERYGDRGFEIVGIHSPEFDHEEDPDAVAAAALDLGVTWPIALDTQKRTFFGWQGNRGFWPRIYLLDRDGDVRYDHVGEGRYDEIDAAVGALLDEQA